MMTVINIEQQIEKDSKYKDYFRQSKDHNEKYFPVKIEDILDEDDEGKRILYVMPDSAKDVFISFLVQVYRKKIKLTCVATAGKLFYTVG